MKTKLTNQQAIRSSRRAAPRCSVPKSRPSPRQSLKLKCILVPIDFSGPSHKALQYAVSLASDYHARIVLIHVVATGLATDEFRRNRILDLESLAREVREVAPATTRVKVGEPIHEIIDLAKSEGADLLLISTHARAGLPDFCLGSAAEQIVRYAPCPVLVVREHERDFLSAPAESSERLLS